MKVFFSHSITGGSKGKRADAKGESKRALTPDTGERRSASLPRSPLSTSSGGQHSAVPLTEAGRTTITPEAENVFSVGKALD